VQTVQAHREPLIPEIRVTPQERARLILVGAAILVIWWLLDQSMSALGPFIFALVAAYLMSPIVERLDRFMPRPAAILIVYAIFIGVVVGVVWWITPAVTHQIAELSERAPDYYATAQEWGRDVLAWYNALPLSDDVRQYIENSLRNLGGAIVQGLQQAAAGAANLVTRTMGFIVGFVIIPFWLFYLLKDYGRGVEALNSMIPRTWRNDVWRILRIINGILSSYIRGQLLLGLIVGVATTIGLMAVGAPYALLLGIISGITEIIPVIGPILGAIPGVAIAAFSGNWVLLLLVLGVYILVQQLENNFLVPKIQGDSVKLHPTVIMVALVIGSQVGGIVGLIAAVPVAAILRDLYLYLYRRLTEEYTPREAEASVPSRQDEESEEGRLREAELLARHRADPDIDSAAEALAELEAGDTNKVAGPRP
jgi:predicted PurR-regulated permease PerM